MKSSSIALILLLAFAGCRTEAEQRPGTTARESTPTGGGGDTPAATDGTRWSEALEGLRIGLELPRSVRLSSLASQSVPQITVRLHFSNVGAEPIRIYLVQTEIFRALISTFLVRAAGVRDVIDMQPEPHPHGYVVTEADFFLIEPGSEQVFTQSLFITDRMRQERELEIEWIYENRVRSWPGGANTMEGVTAPLFGGGDIPYIWVARTSVTSPLTLAP